MIRRFIAAALLLLLAMPFAHAQEQQAEVDYNKPRKYVIGGVSVEGNTYFSTQQIVSITGLQKGMEVTVPGEDLSDIVRRLWLQRY